MSENLARALERIAGGLAVRTDELAADLGIPNDQVDEMLAPACVEGRLVSCTVTVGERQLKEYRLSISGGGKVVAHSFRMSTPAVQRPVHQHAAASAPASAPAPTTSKGDTVKFNKEKVKELFRAHGPLTSRELKKHHGVDNAAQMCSLVASNGEFAKLGGTPKNTVYGLPEQSMADRKPQESADAPPRSIHRRKPHAGGGSAAMRRKSAVKAARKAWRTRRANAKPADKVAPKSFRPALTADGAILFLGAKKGEFEIPRADTRALVDLVRKLTGPELAVAVGFIERLDRAEVAA